MTLGRDARMQGQQESSASHSSRSNSPEVFPNAPLSQWLAQHCRLPEHLRLELDMELGDMASLQDGAWAETQAGAHHTRS